MTFVINLAILTVFMFLLIFFSSEDCLPKKRIFNNMLDDILIYQNQYNNKLGIEFQHKGKTFEVRIDCVTKDFSYELYNVYINNEKVFDYHVLNHCFSKSRERHNCGDRLSNEVDEVLFACRKYANKARYRKWAEIDNKKSYF